MQRANQALKLTEITAAFAPRDIRQKTEMINRYVRAMNYNELAVFRRSLAPIR